MKKAPPRQNRHPAPAAGKHKSLLPLFAVGSSLAAAQAHALEVGDAVVQSRLGQPLRASIALALAPNERLSESCVSLSQGASPSGLPGVGRATITIVDGALLLRGSQPIREPLVSANIVINCPSTPNLSREYMMFIDPPGIESSAPPVSQVTAPAPAMRPEPSAESVSARAPESATKPAAVEPAAATPARQAPRRPATRPVDTAPIGQATRYRVKPGDSLSEITQRIENRKMRLWDAVNVIFEANPDAFIDNDPNMLKAGSWLTIPSLDGSQPVIAASVEPAPVQTAATNQPEFADTVAAEPVEEPAVSQVSADPAVAPSAQGADAVLAEQPVADSTGDLQPFADADAEQSVAAVAPSAPTDVIPDVALEGPRTVSTSPNVTTATASSPEPTVEATASSWLLWLGGAGVAVILGLLLFGRSLRERFAPAPDAEAELPMRSTWQVPEPSGIEVDERVDWGLDNEPTVETEALDADLVMGTGLESSTDSTLGAEIGFPVPTEVDIELPFENESSVDMLEADVVDAVESGEYAAIDDSDAATVEQPRLAEDEPDANAVLDEDEDEELDTRSIEVATIEETSLLPNSTVDPSIAFEMLEQDYEDELSATMALNKELTQAAADLSSVVRAGFNDEASDDDNATASMSLASVTEIEWDGSVDSDAANDDLELALDEATVKMPAPDDEETQETRMMPREQRSVDGKKAG